MHPDWTDHRVEQIIGNLLRFGVVLAALVVLAGGVLELYRHGGEIPHYQAFHGEPGQLRRLGGIVSAAAGFESRGIIQLGLLLLIATPVARVAFSVMAFAVQRDRAYVVVTLIVLAILIHSIAGQHP